MESITREQIEALINQHPDLNVSGLGDPDHLAGLPDKTKAAERARLKADLLSSLEDIAFVVEWLAPVRKTKGINWQYTSYALARAAERSAPRKRLANGAFIAGALLAGFSMYAELPNPYFNMSARSLKPLIDQAYTR